MGDVLTQRRIELETRIEQARQTEVNFESIERFCEQWGQNLGDFTLFLREKIRELEEKLA